MQISKKKTLVRDKLKVAAAIKSEYAEKEKLKKLTTAERLDRLERLMGIESGAG